MLVGSGAGGGYDVYARAFARHWTNHIPGHPNIIAKNMPAAAGLAAAATLYQQCGARRLGDRRLHQRRRDGAAVRQSGRALRRAAVQLARQHRQARERLRHLAHQPGQDHRRCARPRGDRGGGRRHLEFRDRAENAQCPDRHEVQGRCPATTPVRASPWRSSAARPKAFAGCRGRPSRRRGRTGSRTICSTSSCRWGLAKLRDLPDVPSALDLVDDAENKQVMELILIRQEAGRRLPRRRMRRPTASPRCARRSRRPLRIPGSSPKRSRRNWRSSR